MRECECAIRHVSRPDMGTVDIGRLDRPGEALILVGVGTQRLDPTMSLVAKVGVVAPEVLADRRGRLFDRLAQLRLADLIA